MNAIICVDNYKAVFNPNRDCNCPNQCNAELYDVTVTDLDWPTKPAFEQFLASSHGYMRNDDSRTLLVDALEKYKEERLSINSHSMTSIKATFGRFNVFFSDIAITVIEERPVYNFVLVVSNFGGLLGLYLGFSVLTVLELVDFGFDLVEYFRLRGKHFALTTSQTRSKNENRRTVITTPPKSTDHQNSRAVFSVTEF